MNKKIIMVLAGLALLGLACSSNQTIPVQGGANPDQQTTGMLRLTMANGDDSADAGLAKKSTDSVEHIYVTIREVQLHVAGDTSDNGWKTVATPNQRFDFLSLVNGLTAPLDLYSLPAGHYTQIRLILGDEWTRYYWDTVTSGAPNEIVVNGEAFPLTIPSAYNTGIKCVRSFFIAPGEATEICLRFEVRKAVHFAPGNGWMMKPAFQTFKCDSVGNQSDNGKKNNNGNKDKTVPDTTNNTDDGILHYPLP
jgi:hypothetical protein